MLPHVGAPPFGLLLFSGIIRAAHYLCFPYLLETFLINFCLYGCLACLYVCAFLVHCQETVLNPMELELQTAVNRNVGAWD